MAFIEQVPGEDEEDNPNLSRESGVISGSGLASRPSSRPSKTGYVNVQDYVSANQPGIEQFAKDVGAGVSGAVTGSQRGTGQLLESFKGQQAPDIDYGQLSTYLTQEGLQEGEQDLVGRALQSGKAPKNLTEMPEYQKALKEHQEAMEMLKLSQGGTSQLGALAQKVIKPQQYGAGLRGLDASLLAAQKDFPKMVQSGGGTKDPNAPASDRFVGSGQDYFEKAGKEAGEIADTAGSRREAGLGLIKGAAGTRLTGLEGQLKGQQTAASDKIKAEQQKVIDDYLATLAPTLTAMGYGTAPDMSDFSQLQGLPEKHFGQFATEDQAKEFDVLRSLIDPGYSLGMTGYGSGYAPTLDKAGYEQKLIDAYLERLGMLPTVGGAEPDKFKTKGMTDLLAEKTEFHKGQRRGQEEKAGVSPETSAKADVLSDYILPGAEHLKRKDVESSEEEKEKLARKVGKMAGGTGRR